MRTIFKEALVVLVPETDEEVSEVKSWLARHEGQVLEVGSQTEAGGRAIELRSLGRRADACREPINIVSSSPDPMTRLISNFGSAPFEMDGQHYRSVESFWQGLKFSDLEERQRIADLDAREAHAVGDAKGYGATILYGGADIPIGTWAHWQLMEQACLAKFTQHAEARAALLATGGRPLVHHVRRDSKAIPGAIMAEIWMRIRGNLQSEAGAATQT